MSHRGTILTVSSETIRSPVRSHHSTDPLYSGGTLHVKHSGVLALVFSAYLVPIYADAIFTLGNDPQPGEQNVLFNRGMSSSTVTGVTNQTDTTVIFTSLGNTLVTTTNGQANLTASGGLITDLTISLAGGATF